MKGSKPLVSVLMGVYNASKTLDKAIESVLKQTFSDFEFIICDDASKDDSVKIIEQFADKDERIKILENEQNLGLGATLNRCLEFASGEYIARQDADDISDEHRIERTLEYLQNQKCGYVGCGVKVFDDKGVWGDRLFPENITKHIIAQKNPFFHPTMIFEADTIRSVNGYRVSKETIRTEDYDLVMRLAGNGIIGKNLQEYLYYVYEPAEAYSRHTLKTRRYEVCVRYKGLKYMGAPLRDYIYLVKPIIMCCIPKPLLKTAKKMQWKICGR